MKALVLGLGSMGKRRIRCLLALGIPPDSIFGFDIRGDRCEEAREKYQIYTTTVLEQLPWLAANIAIISTPPDRHEPYLMRALSEGLDVFVEASVILEGLDACEKLREKQQCLVFPSSTMRYFQGPQKIKSILESGVLGTIYAWQYQSGQYLPDWHPWESVEEYYVSNRETGGAREIVPFELSWLTALFGSVVEVDGRVQKFAQFAPKIDDFYSLQVMHETGVLGQLIVEVLSRSAVRTLRITAENGSLIWEDDRSQIRLFTIDKGWETFSLEKGSCEGGYINPEQPYIAEITAFLECVREKKSPEYDLISDIKILSTLLDVEQSHLSAKRISRKIL